MSVFQNALILAPSYLSSFFPPDVGETRFQPNSAYNEFLSKAGQDGHAFILPNRFLVLIENPWLEEKFNFVSTGMSSRLSLRCYTANVPSKAFQTHERDIAGPKRLIPYTTSFDSDLSLQFYCGQDLGELNFFQDWMDSIINPVSRYAAFYDDYAKNSKITILFLHNSLKSTEGIMKAYRNGNLSGIRFLEAYPKTMSINGGPLEWAAGKNSPLFAQVFFGTREFVNIRTYDAELDKQMKRLEQSDLTNSLDDLLARTEDQNLAFGGAVLQKELLKPTISADGMGMGSRNILPAQTTESFGNVASDGAVISTSQTVSQFPNNIA
jgi:hypothetical protein